MRLTSRSWSGPIPPGAIRSSISGCWPPARERGTRIVVIDPRRTATAAEADLHLALKPGTDVLLFNGLLAHLADKGVLDRAYIDAHTTGFEAALALADADAGSIDKVAVGCGLAAADVARFYDWFAVDRSAASPSTARA